MKLICEGLNLSDAVLKVIRATATKTTNPILEGIKLKASEDTLTLSATDLEISIEKTIPADVKIQGEVVILGKIFSEFIKKLSKEQLELETTEKNELLIHYGENTATLQCLNRDEFPTIKNIQSSKEIEINKTELKKSIDKTVCCAAIDDARPVLKGCLFEVGNGNLTVVALDGYKLAKYETQINSNDIMKCIVPTRSLNEISKLLITANKDEKIKLNISDNYLMIDDDNTKIISRLILGEYLNYKQVIPQTFKTRIKVNRSQLETGLERCSLFTKSDRNNMVKLDINQNTLAISSASSIGNTKENINIECEGENLLIAFNSNCFNECVKQLSDEFVYVNFGGQYNPCTITGTEDNKNLYLVLPVRIVD